MNFNELWMNLFGTTAWYGIDIGFWVSMFACLVVVILMNVVFWGIKPKAREAFEGTSINRDTK